MSTNLDQTTAKIKALKSNIVELLKPHPRLGEQKHFDPQKILEYFERFASLRSRLAILQPVLFNDLPIRELPEASKTTDNDGRGYITNPQLKLLLLDIDYCLQVLAEVTTHQIQSSNSIYDEKKIKVFLSHRDSVKKEAKKLASILEKYGVSCFVAHDSIVPMTTWKNEILKALEGMDAFICFITNDYYESCWTNQEVGYAIAKNVPIYLYSFDRTDPDGFKLDIQAIKNGENILIDLIKKDYSNHPVLKESLIKNFTDAKNGTFRNAKDRFIEILPLSFTDQEIENIVTAIQGTAQYANQLQCLLTDPISEEHKNNIPSKIANYYYELLEGNIFSQHSQKRYAVIKTSEKTSIKDNIQ